MSTWWGGDVNVYDKYIAPKWLQDCMICVELKWHMDEQVEWPGGGGNVKSADESSDLISDY